MFWLLSISIMELWKKGTLVFSIKTKTSNVDKLHMKKLE